MMLPRLKCLLLGHRDREVVLYHALGLTPLSMIVSDWCTRCGRLKRERVVTYSERQAAGSE